MAPKILLTTMLFASLYGCTKETRCVNDSELGTVTFRATQSNSPFTGALEILPCVLNTSKYFGNYVNNVLSAISPSYVISNGVISASGIPLLLPIGKSYTLLYWGVDSGPSYQEGVSISGGVTLTTDFLNTYWNLRQNSKTTTYKPAYNQVMAIKNVQIGAIDVDVPLKRVVAGLNVIVKNKNNTPFANEINDFNIFIDGISSKLNYITAKADMSTLVTVEFPLTISTDRMQADNLTAMLYPSVANPKITITATLADGTTKSHTTNLTNPFVAGEIQTVTIVIDEITGGSGALTGFSVTNWTEVSENIDFGIL